MSINFDKFLLELRKELHKKVDKCTNFDKCEYCAMIDNVLINSYEIKIENK